MEIKCGTDIIEISRIKKSIEELGDSFINKIYTEKEIEYCESKGQQKYQHYAVRFAGKEAIFKAISESVDENYLVWTDYEILREPNGKPKININNKIANIIQSADISMSHCKEYAVANVAIIYKERE